MPRFSPLIQLILVSLAAHMALAGSRVTTSLYALSLQASAFTLGLLIALFALFPMMFAVSMGRLVDRIGIATPMIGGGLAIGVGCLMPGVFSGLPILYLAVIFVGTGFMAIHVSSQHAVGAMSTSATRAANFSWLALGYSISGFCGPVIAGFVIDYVNYRVAYVVFFGFALIATIVSVCGSVGRSRQKHDKEKVVSGSSLDLLRDPEMRRIYLIGILLAGAWDLFTFVMPIHGSTLGFSAATIGLVLGCFSVATFMVRLGMPWISRRYSEWQVLFVSLVVAVVCYMLFPFMRDPLSLMAVAAILGLAVGASQPNMLALIHHTAPAGRTGEAVGVRVTIGNASQVILPLAFGAAGSALGLFAVFWGMGAMIGSGVVLVWRKAFLK